MLRRKGNIGRFEIAAAAFGVMVAATIFYIWTNTLPGEAVVIETP